MISHLHSRIQGGFLRVTAPQAVRPGLECHLCHYDLEEIDKSLNLTKPYFPHL